MGFSRFERQLGGRALFKMIGIFSTGPGSNGPADWQFHGRGPATAATRPPSTVSPPAAPAAVGRWGRAVNTQQRPAPPSPTMPRQGAALGAAIADQANGSRDGGGLWQHGTGSQHVPARGAVDEQVAGALTPCRVQVWGDRPHSCYRSAMLSTVTSSCAPRTRSGYKV